MKPYIFLSLSILLGYLSRDFLRDRRSHGFYRFIAFESILGLFLTNVDHWFRSPFSLPQLISWCFLLAAAILVSSGVWLLRRYGLPSESREDGKLIGFEKTTRLVEEGVYGHIRHPLYASLLFLAWGIFLKDASWLTGVLVIIASISLDFTAGADEKESIGYFGQAYEDYMDRTKRFIPFVY